MCNREMDVTKVPTETTISLMRMALTWTAVMRMDLW
jgi:hypothetical protein